MVRFFRFGATLVNGVFLRLNVTYCFAEERLIFDWSSGLESSKSSFRSEAMMYDLVMCIVSEGLGKAGVATETSVAGEFAAASREYVAHQTWLKMRPRSLSLPTTSCYICRYGAAAGIFEFLNDDILPKWAARGAQVDEADLPVECCVETAKGLSMLFKANGQQMAVATVLIKPGIPNYSLLAKLCLGIVEQLEAFIAWMRDNAFKQMARIEKDFFTLITFQIQLQKSLSLYFHSRCLWAQNQEYGLAIAFLSDATINMRTRASEASDGIPDVAKIPTLRALKNDLDDLRSHMALLLETWERDNSSVYFEAVPRSVPADKKIEKGLCIGKSEKYKMKDADPVLLALPEDAMKRSDSDLARELQRKLDAGLEI